MPTKILYFEKFQESLKSMNEFLQALDSATQDDSGILLSLCDKLYGTELRTPRNYFLVKMTHKGGAGAEGARPPLWGRPKAAPIFPDLWFSEQVIFPFV